MELDVLDKKLLNLTQAGLPLVEEPYKELGQQLDISEAEVLERLHRLKDQNIIRRLGGVFDSRKLGYKGTLCALKVPFQRIEEVAQVINRYPGITHNYLRHHPYNMWFTVLAQSPQQVTKILGEITKETGIDDVLNLPAESFFKLKVNFQMNEVEQHDRDGKTPGTGTPIRLTPSTSPLRRIGNQNRHVRERSAGQGRGI